MINCTKDTKSDINKIFSAEKNTVNITPMSNKQLSKTNVKMTAKKAAIIAAITTS